MKRRILNASTIIGSLLIFFGSLAFAEGRGLQWVETAQPVNEQRTALVIGNGDYVSSPLRNPANDAEDIAEALRATGFSVQLETNLDRTG